MFKRKEQVQLDRLIELYKKSAKTLIDMSNELPKAVPIGSFVRHKETNEKLTILGHEGLSFKVVTESGERHDLEFTEILEWEIATKKKGVNFE